MGFPGEGISDSYYGRNGRFVTLYKGGECSRASETDGDQTVLRSVGLAVGAELPKPPQTRWPPFYLKLNGARTQRLQNKQFEVARQCGSRFPAWSVAKNSGGQPAILRVAAVLLAWFGRLSGRIQAVLFNREPRPCGAVALRRVLSVAGECC